MKTNTTATATLLALAALLAAPAVTADHPDNECWTVEQATGCYLEDAVEGLACAGWSTIQNLQCVLANEQDAAQTYARRVCDALTGQACTQP